MDSFDTSAVPTMCLVKIVRSKFAISKWVLSKRTRSYPYAHIYNTLGNGRRIAVTPILKDEGQAGTQFCSMQLGGGTNNPQFKTSSKIITNFVVRNRN